MAGSWDHMTVRGGKLRNNETFCNQIENLGDAYEAAEECYGMIQWLADRIARVYAGEQSQRQYWVDEAVKHYLEGLRLGGVQRER